MTKTEAVAKAKKLAIQYDTFTGERKEKALKRYNDLVALLGYDPLA